MSDPVTPIDLDESSVTTTGPYISRITIPDGAGGYDGYEIKDAYARSRLEILQNVYSNPLRYRGKVGSDSPITDGAEITTYTLWSVNDTGHEQTSGPYRAHAGDIVIKEGSSGKAPMEYIYDGQHWSEFGSTGSLGSLAFKSSASCSYTPAGSVSTPTFTGTGVRLVTGNITVPKTYTSTFTGTAATITVSGTATGSVSTTTATTENKTTTVTTASGTATYTPGGSVSQPTFSGTAATITVSGTATGSVSQPTFTGTAVRLVTGNIAVPATYTSTFTGTAATIEPTATYTPAGSISLSTTNKTAEVTKANSGTATYTPQGTVSTPTISVKTAGTTGSVSDIYYPVGFTNVQPTNAQLTGSTATHLPFPELTSYNEASEQLTIHNIWYSLKSSTTGTAPTGVTSDSLGANKASRNFKTGDAAYQSSQPTFTGTGARLVTGNIAVPSSATFTGTQATITSSTTYTPAGSVATSTATTSNKTATVSKATSGEATFTPQGSVSAPTFTGTTFTSTGDYTPQGTVSTPTFTGTGVRLVTGNIAVPKTYTSTFTGTAFNSTGSYTPAGSVATTTATTENKSTTVTKAASGDTTFTPQGTVSKPSFTGTTATITVS